MDYGSRYSRVALRLTRSYLDTLGHDITKSSGHKYVCSVNNSTQEIQRSIATHTHILIAHEMNTLRITTCNIVEIFVRVNISEFVLFFIGLFQLSGFFLQFFHERNSKNKPVSTVYVYIEVY